MSLIVFSVIGDQRHGSKSQIFTEVDEAIDKGTSWAGFSAISQSFSIG